MANKKAAKKKRKGTAARRAAHSLAALEDEEVNPLDVLLDPNNPRLPAMDRGSDQSRLLEIMITRFKVEEVAESIIAEGYVALDPVLVWKEGGNTYVREGNRRIAAVQLLLDPSKAPPRQKEAWDQRSRDAAPVADTFRKIGVKVVPDPATADVLAYIGFRHVSGNLQWPPFEKAEHIARLIEETRLSYRDAARRIGSRADAVERHYVAYRLIEQAKRQGLEGTDKIQFGTLMRALNSGGVRRFLGVEYPGDARQSKKPVSANKVKHLGEFVRWTFGTEESAPVLEDSRQLTDWGRILESASALSYMRNTAQPRFSRAFYKCGAEGPSVEEAMATAADRMEEALPHVREHKGDKGLEREVGRCANMMSQILDYFPNVQDEYFG